MQIVYAPEAPPASFTKSIFLAGPSPRDPSHLNWRPEAIKILEDMGYDGVVFVPLPRDGEWLHQYDPQVEWELNHLNMADVVMFWVPRSKELLAMTTNVEYGVYFDSGKAVLGYPPTATQMRYLNHLAKGECVEVRGTLEDTVRAAVERLGDGAKRTGGERSVPLHIWKLPHFQGWYQSQMKAGNRLDGARLLWSFRVGKNKGFTLAFSLQVDVHVAAEGRNKSNEFVIYRPDISTVVAYRKRIIMADTGVVLIREFRSPARTSDGFIHEVPGGSSFKPGEDPFVTAAHELSEEAGLSVNPSRIRRVGTRQLCGTLSAHQAHVFACELTGEELVALEAQQDEGTSFGVAGDTERTYIEVRRLGDLLTTNDIDWSMLGMVLAAVSQ